MITVTINADRTISAADQAKIRAHAKRTARYGYCTSCEDNFDRLNAAEERGVEMKKIPLESCPCCGGY